MIQRIAPAALLLAAIGTAAHGADVYRTTAPDGTVSYSDRPQGADSQFVLATRPTATTRTTTPAAANAPAPAPTAAAAAQAAPQAPADPTLPEGASSAELREQRQKNCGIARERLDRYALSRRLFRPNDAGEREYLDEAATAEARAKAAADVEDWCD
jgi:hypothetical protein